MNAEKALALLVNLWAEQNGLEVTKLTLIKKENSNHERASKPVHRPQDRRTAAAP